MNSRAYALLDETKVHASSRSACVPQRWAFSQNELFSTSEMKEYVKACVSDMASSMSFVWACVFVCVCVSLTCSREKKNTPKNNKDDGVILWCSGEVILTPTDWNIYQTFLEKIQVQKLPMKSAQSISHFVINIIYFFNIIQHLIQIPYSWEDGWMDGTP